MKTLLRIDTSFNLEKSYSRTIADFVEKKWLAKNPGATILRRDLAENQVPHLSRETAMDFYQGSRDLETLQLSNALIDEIKSADTLLISSPVFNHGIPSTLKAYIDLIVRINETFGYDGQTNVRSGLLQTNDAFVVVARGGLPQNGTPPDHVEDYLTGILNFMGIQNVHAFSIYGTATQNASNYIEQVKSKITAVV